MILKNFRFCSRVFYYGTRHFQSDFFLEGALRVDANISVRPIGSQVLGVRTEVKNIGGVNNVLKAVNYEIDRQLRFRRAGKEIVNETRAWDAAINRTVVMRDKEVMQVVFSSL